jgi:hypothetical protein
MIAMLPVLARTDGVTPLASAQYPTASVCDQGGPTQYAFEDHVLDAERRELQCCINPTARVSL